MKYSSLAELGYMDVKEQINRLGHLRNRYLRQNFHIEIVGETNTFLSYSSI